MQGKGTRLLPYTNILPKPLFPILGKPVIEIILDQLKNLGITFIGINTFHLKNKTHKFP
uniref:Nucleotidyl transferase domain-containing protein n=1 Tax=Thermodesulfobacterium geofontis TaxID=1295609 RepID=A0A7C4NSS4_9BACT